MIRGLEDRAARGGAIGLTLSIGLHLGLAWLASTYGTLPELGFDFELPAEVDFGLTDETTVAAATAAESAAPPPEEPPKAADEGLGLEDAGAPSPDAGQGSDAGATREPLDAGVDAGPLVASADAPDAGIDAGIDAGALVASADAGPPEAVRLPAGAQIALRLDLGRVRASPLAPDVRRLLAAIPDWDAVLGGSGLDPLDDLDRVLIASPNLQRARAIFAGRYEAGRVDPRAVAERMATAHGATVTWRAEHGVEVAPWANADDTERVLALVGPRHFAISRAEDLPVLLGVASARAAELAAELEEGEELPPEAGADALLSMLDGEALSVEVEGVHNFVRGQIASVPARLRVSVRELPDGRAQIEAEGRFADAESAERAKQYWTAVRDNFARHPLVALAGLSSPLRATDFEAREELLLVHAMVGARHIRLALAQIEVMLEQQRRRQSPGVPSSSPPPLPSP